MTSAINANFSSRSRGNAASRGFTLVELLLVIGILALLMGLLLPAVSKTYARAIRIRTQADLQTISVALEAYKSDFSGFYPPVTSANAGAAVLCKALVGPADEAKFYTGTLSAFTVSNTMVNAPPVGNTYSASKVYQAGDLVTTTGTPLTYQEFVDGTQASVFICVRNDTQADGVNRTPNPTQSVPINDAWWSRFLPYDGSDGTGVKARLAAAADPADGRPHAAAGKTYGPYLPADRIKSRGCVLLDRYDSPILYFPINKSATPTAPNSFVNGYSYPRVTSTTPPETLSMINANDNIGAFGNDAVTAETAAMRLAKVRVSMGDFNVNGVNDTVPGGPIEVGEPSTPTVPFLLWTAGPDHRFGPTGIAASTGSWVRGDYYTTGHGGENQATYATLDDVTNFRP